jgi:sugar phosphate isomerase/epimerase
MKISFSTLGCPAWNLEKVIELARREKYDGIELRFIENDDRLWQRSEFHGRGLKDTLRRLDEAGLKISCVDTSCYFHHPDAGMRRQSLEMGKAMMDLAAALGARGIRVFGDRIQEGADRASTSAWIAENVGDLADFGKPLQVQVWLESHGDFARAADTLEVLKLAGNDNARVLWDPVNAFAEFNEIPAVGLKALGAKMQHVHLKDVRPPRKKPATGHPALLWDPVLMGEGRFPARDLLRLLGKNQYSGFVSFEWEKRWHPEIPEPEKALPHFIKWVQATMASIQEEDQSG